MPRELLRNLFETCFETGLGKSGAACPGVKVHAHICMQRQQGRRRKQMAELIQQTDFQILDWIQANIRTPWLDWLMPKITFLCENGWFWIVLTLVLLIWKRHRKCGWGMFTALILSLLIGNLLLKHAVARPRPCWINTDIDMLVAIPKDFSFPSGHSMASFASATVLMTYDRRVGIPALILSALIAFSRLYLYVHFPTDVLVGTLLGIVMGIIAPRIVEAIQEKLRRKREDGEGRDNGKDAA